jgi:hypothetical protein
VSNTGGEKASRSSRAARPDHGVFDADKFWGHTLTGPTTSDQPDAFDARVERTWRFMRSMFFTPDENKRLQEVLLALLTAGKF